MSKDSKESSEKSKGQDQINLPLSSLKLLSSEPSPSFSDFSNEKLNSIACEVIHELSGKNTYSDNVLIGEGGMGAVEQVTDNHCHRTIARKTLHKECNSIEAYVRFTEEVQITAQLEHPNIIPIYEMGVDDKNRIFYTMKLIQGRNLKEILKDIKNGKKEVIEKFPLSRLLQIFTNICDASSYACSHKVVHRDLKPDNIMVGDFGEVYLVDWGLAKITDKETYEYNNANFDSDKIIDPGKTQNIFRQLKNIESLRDKIDVSLSMNNVIVGTPHYMAPERFTGEADEISEIYALGSILYNILTLKMTVNTSDVEEIIEMIIEGKIKAPSAYKKDLNHLPNSKVPEALSAICMKALSPDRESRYNSIKELISDIQLWQQGFVTKAENAGLVQVFWLAIKRHKFESATLLAFIVIMLVVYSFFVMGIEKQRLLFDMSKENAMKNRHLIDSRITEIDENSQLIEEKISELKSLAGHFFSSSREALKDFKVEKALNQIDTSISLDRKDRSLLERAFILLLNERYLDASKQFAEIMHSNSNEFLQEAKTVADKLGKKNRTTVKDLLVLRSLSKNYKRSIDAAIYHDRISLKNKGILTQVLEELKKTNFNFVNEKNLTIDVDGNFSLDATNKGISNISALRGLPFTSIILDENPIKAPATKVRLPFLWFRNFTRLFEI